VSGPDLARLGPTTVVGLVVEARWNELFQAVPDAWRQLFARADELRQLAGAGRFVEVSLGMKDDVYTELVGIEVSNDILSFPAGMRRLDIPTGDWLHLHHTGDVTGIAACFGALYAHAEAESIAVSDLKFDFGYAPAGSDGPHDLYLSLENNAAPQWREQSPQEAEHG
jgi:predicted transcriptional regulator YdeE